MSRSSLTAELLSILESSSELWSDESSLYFGLFSLISGCLHLGLDKFLESFGIDTEEYVLEPLFVSVIPILWNVLLHIIVHCSKVQHGLDVETSNVRHISDLDFLSWKVLWEKGKYQMWLLKERALLTYLLGTEHHLLHKANLDWVDFGEVGSTIRGEEGVHFLLGPEAELQLLGWYGLGLRLTHLPSFDVDLANFKLYSSQGLNLNERGWMLRLTIVGQLLRLRRRTMVNRTNSLHW